ncbi:hypothetical protein C1H46_007816 [Malus baccata]|uniref:Uncharacterized protein n=1 Tax=Malus baccata TaxID=106549 RepID=A0A540N697_MALBA|nr:hypothetical protein C1H46_007816 [Malus baccata]
MDPFLRPEFISGFSLAFRFESSLAILPAHLGLSVLKLARRPRRGYTQGTSRQKTSTDFKKEVKNLRLAFIDMFLKYRTLARELQSHRDLDAKNKAELKRLKGAVFSVFSCTYIFLQEAASQPLPEILIEDVTVPEDAGLQILTDPGSEARSSSWQDCSGYEEGAGS